MEAKEFKLPPPPSTPPPDCTSQHKRSLTSPLPIGEGARRASAIDRHRKIQEIAMALQFGDISVLKYLGLLDERMSSASISTTNDSPNSDQSSPSAGPTSPRVRLISPKAGPTSPRFQTPTSARFQYPASPRNTNSSGSTAPTSPHERTPGSTKRHRSSLPLSRLSIHQRTRSNPTSRHLPVRSDSIQSNISEQARQESENHIRRRSSSKAEREIMLKIYVEKHQTWKGDKATLKGEAKTILKEFAGTLKPSSKIDPLATMYPLEPLLTLVLDGVDLSKFPRKDEMAYHLPPPRKSKIKTVNYKKVKRNRRGSDPRFNTMKFNTMALMDEKPDFAPPQPKTGKDERKMDTLALLGSKPDFAPPSVTNYNTMVLLQNKPGFAPPKPKKSKKQFGQFLGVPGASSMENLKRTLKLVKKQKEDATMKEDFQTVVNINKQIKTLNRTMNTLRRKRASPLTRRSSELIKAKILKLKAERKQEALEEKFDRCIEICKEVETLQEELKELRSKRKTEVGRFDSQLLSGQRTYGNTRPSSESILKKRAVPGSIGLSEGKARVLCTDYFEEHRGKPSHRFTILVISRLSRTVCAAKYLWEEMFFGKPSGSSNSGWIHFYLKDKMKNGKWIVTKMVTVGRESMASVAKWDS